MAEAATKSWVAPLIAAAISGTAGAGSVYAVASDYSEAIADIRVDVALCKASAEHADREIERLWKRLRR